MGDEFGPNRRLTDLLIHNAVAAATIPVIGGPMIYVHRPVSELVDLNS